MVSSMSEKPFDEFKKRQLIVTLRKTSGNRTLTASKLKVSVRTIRNWMKRFNLNTEFPPIRGRKA